MLRRLRLAHLQPTSRGHWLLVSSAIAFPRHLPRRRCHVSRIVSAVERFPLGTVISSVEKLVAASRSQSNVRRRRRRQNYRTTAASLQNDLDGLRIFTDH